MKSRTQLLGILFGFHTMLISIGLLINGAFGFGNPSALFQNGIGFFAVGFTITLICGLVPNSDEERKQ